MKVVSGIARGIILFEVNKSTTRSITARIKTSLFDKLQPFIIDEPILDLYAGTGSMGIEALSRGASSCVFVDRDLDCFLTIQKNVKKTNFEEKSEIIKESVSQFLEKNETRKFKIILYDPPFPIVKSAYNTISDEISLMKPHLLDDAAIIFRHPMGTFQSIEGFEVLDQKEYGISEITFLVKAGANG